jgi:hypothetical protein
MSYVVVHFAECREVFIDNQSQGNNVDEHGVPRSLFCGEGWHSFRLGGAANYQPPLQILIVPDATPINPFAVTFELHP